MPDIGDSQWLTQQDMRKTTDRTERKNNMTARYSFSLRRRRNEQYQDKGA
jgi:hypothetical protein